MTPAAAKTILRNLACALLFFALAALSFALLANRWKSPEKWLVR